MYENAHAISGNLGNRPSPIADSLHGRYRVLPVHRALPAAKLSVPRGRLVRLGLPVLKVPWDRPDLRGLQYPPGP